MTRMWTDYNLSTLLIQIQNGVTIVDNNLLLFQKTKHRITM